MQSLQFAIAYLSHFAIVALTLSTFCLEFQVFYLLLVLLNLVDEFLLALPFGFIFAYLLLEFSDVLIQLCELFLIILTLDGFTLNLKLGETTCLLVELLWQRVALHTQFCCGFIHQVDSFIRQETV